MGTPLKLLIVEDCADRAAQMVRELGRSGYAPVWTRVETAADFLAELRQAPDLIIAGGEMGGLSGPQAAELARESGLEIPFVLVAGTRGEDLAEMAGRCGAADFLHAEGLGRLGNVVRQLLHEKQMFETYRLLREEADLRERRLKSFFDSATVGMVLLDKELRYVRVSDSLARINGVPAGEHPGKSPWEIIPDIASQILPLLEQVRDTQKPITNMEVSAARGGTPGEVRHWAVSYFPVPGNDGGIDGVGGVVVDVTGLKRSKEALRASEKRYRNTLDNMLEGCQIIGSDWRYLYVNDAVVRHVRKPKDQLLGHTMMEVFPGIENTPLFARAKLCMEQRIPQQLENEFTYPNGEISWFELSLQPVPEGIFLLSIDITKRKRTEQALLGSEAEFRAVFELASIGMAQADPRTGHFLRVNRKYCEITGYSEAELLQRNVSDLTHPEDRTRDRERFERVVRGEAPDYHIEKRYLRKDGTTVWVSINMTVLRDAAGRALRTMATIEDITGKRKAVESQARLAMAVEQSAESIIITDARGNIQYVNPAFERLTGYTRGEALGQNPRVLKSDRHDAEFYRAMWDTLLRGETWSGHMTNRRKDGTLFEEEAAISPIRDAGGAIVSYVAVKRDVTRERQLEEQFHQAQKMEAIGQMAGGIAHDFNNLLLVIQLQTSMMLLEPGLDAGNKEKVQEIAAAVERAAALTRQLLTFSRQGRKQARNLRLGESFDTLVKWIRRILGEDIELETRFAPDVPPVHADEGMMEQVLMNLAINARDAMPRGGSLCVALDAVTFGPGDTGATGARRPGRFVCLTVSDSGCGIAPEHLQRIFEPFFTTKEVGKGTGLGLATVFGIVKQHQGWVEVDSRVDAGTTFRVYLPAVESEPSAAPAVAPKPAGGRGETILLVEDEPMARKMAALILERQGYRVVAAGSAEQALEQWQAHRREIRLVLTDLIMPGAMSGIDLARALTAEVPSLCVVYTSGYSEELVAGRPDFPGCSSFLQKPYTVPDLLAAVRRCLDHPPAGI